ncbi:integral membrane sensor signal transduction histidine kinase [Paenibacillus mucilaginosus KNP414]|uniref:histidine kinase n=2 Tax=Paenibacillus mucilaginosus TaxID=61624 RepID=F8FJS6_PAEMK|nr:integral membrane sensor signal transduction histidine kinase [Paenibacillus mucilaginosus KNP414]
MSSTVRSKSSAYRYLQGLTLKRRIMILFLGSSLIPFLSIGAISYSTIYSMLQNKIQSGIVSNLKGVQQSLENTLTNLNHVSQQLAFEGSVGRKLDLLLAAKEPYERSRLTEEVRNELSLITFTNPNIGLTLYYFQKEGTTIFENMGVKDGFAPEKAPLLGHYNGISYYGPHPSSNRFVNQIVLSALRRVELPDRQDVYVYIESGFRLTSGILTGDGFGGKVAHLILDHDGRVAYSHIPSVFPVDSLFPGFTREGTSGEYAGHYWFRERSSQGWSVLSVIPAGDYNREMNRWWTQVLLSSLVFLLISLLLGWLLWKMVYKPLGAFHGEIESMEKQSGQGQPGGESAVETAASLAPATHIPEFDDLLQRFREMRGQIWTLFAEVEQKEKRRADLEVEKLLYQINPHFLMNTLDTVHWLAVLHGQGEIDRLVQSLNKLLYYNLGKLGQESTIREELDALQQYLTLQEIRYDFKFLVRIEADERVLDTPIPRFLLQPLVENALYHGLDDEGLIEVDVRQEGSAVRIIVQDNGAGMSEEAVRRLLEEPPPEERRVGMGIGMNYVKRMMAIHYGEGAGLTIRSAAGEGTRIELRLPLTGEDYT